MTKNKYPPFFLKKKEKKPRSQESILILKLSSVEITKKYQNKNSFHLRLVSWLLGFLWLFGYIFFFKKREGQTRFQKTPTGPFLKN